MRKFNIHFNERDIIKKKMEIGLEMEIKNYLN